MSKQEERNLEEIDNVKKKQKTILYKNHCNHGFTEIRVYKHESNIVCYKKGIFRKQKQSLGY